MRVRRTIARIAPALALCAGDAFAQGLSRPETTPQLGQRPEIVGESPPEGRPTPRPPLPTTPPGAYPLILEPYYDTRPPKVPYEAEPAPYAVEPAPRAQGTVRFREDAVRADGFLEVAGDTPGATVYVDGRQVGRTPLRRTPLAPGERKIRVAKYGYKGFETTVAIEPGEVARVQATLTPLR